MLVRDMLSDGRDEFLRGKDLEVFPIAPVGHGRPVEDFAGVLQVGNLLLGEGVSQDIFRQRLLPLPVVSGDAVSGMDAESAVMPGHEFFDKPAVYPALSLQHGQDLGAEDLFELFQFSFGQTMEGAVRSKEPVGDDGMKMRMKPGVIPEGMDDRDHPQDAVIEAQHRAKETSPGSPWRSGTVASGAFART